MRMSFFVKSLLSFIYYNLSQLKKCFYSIYLKFLSKKVYSQKRTSSFIFYGKASLSIEAALVFPLFLASCMMILFFSELFRLETRVSELLYNSSKVYAQYTGLPVNEELSDNALYKVGVGALGIYEVSKLFNEELEKGFDELFLMKKMNIPYSFAFSRIDDNYVDLIVIYRVKFNLPFIPLPEIPVVQRCKFHAWSGNSRKSASDSDDIIVYVTSTGKVYHRNRDCTYIKLSISSVNFDDVSSKRNNSGAKYYACERCVKNGSANKLVYITYNGTRYHNSLNCSELKRTVHEVRLSDVKDSKKPCSKCGL